MEGRLYTKNQLDSSSRFDTKTLLVASICGPPAAISCSYRDTGVPCSVVGPFLCPTRRPATRYQTTWEIRHVPLTESFSFLVLIAYTAHYRLCDHALYKSTIDRQHLRSATQQLMVVPRHRLTTVGRRAFAVHSPMVWNSLPDDLRAQQDYESFRQGLKTWLFSRY